MTRWDSLYRDDPRIPTVSPSHAAARAAELFLQEKKRFILDVGCGAGRDSRYLAGRGLQVVGVEPSAPGLALAVHSPVGGLSYVQGDARHLPLAAALFDGAYCFGVLHEFVEDWLGNSLALLVEVRRVLCSGGLLVLTVCAGDPLAGLPHVQLFDAGMLAAVLRGWRVRCLDKYDDRGCTGRTDYRVWYVVLAS